MKTILHLQLNVVFCLWLKNSIHACPIIPLMPLVLKRLKTMSCTVRPWDYTLLSPWVCHYCSKQLVESITGYLLVACLLIRFYVSWKYNSECFKKRHYVLNLWIVFFVYVRWRNFIHKMILIWFGAHLNDSLCSFL